MLISIIIKTISLSIHIWTSTKMCRKIAVSIRLILIFYFIFRSFVYLSIGRNMLFQYRLYSSKIWLRWINRLLVLKQKNKNIKTTEKNHSFQLKQQTMFDQMISMRWMNCKTKQKKYIYTRTKLLQFLIIMNRMWFIRIRCQHC